MLDPGQDGANAQALVDDLGQLGNLGFQTAIVSLSGVEALSPIEIVGRDVLPQVRDFGAVRARAA
jgi:hypothetical protein